jgi:EmrB/QacA subfamily drug resistance transporter
VSDIRRDQGAGAVPRRSGNAVTFLVLATGVFAFALLQSMVTPVLPTIQHDLHTSQTTVTWLLTIYLLSASIFTPILGRIGDMVGKERMFVLTLGALAAGSLLAALAWSIGVLIAARAVQGIGGAVMPLAFGIVRDEFRPAKVAGGVGTIAALGSAGAGIGIVLAGPIVDGLGYRWLFWLPMIVTAVAGVAAYFLVPASPVRTPGGVSWLAALLLSGSLLSLLLAVSQGPSWGWTDRRILGLAVLSVLLGLAWVMVELRTRHPLIDMRMMRIPAVWTTNVVALLFGACMYSIFAFLPEFVQTPARTGYGFGASVAESGLFLLPMAVAMFALGLAAGQLSQRFGSKLVLLVGSTVSIVPFLLLTYAHAEKWQVYLASGLVGIGFGLAFSAISNLIVAAVVPEQTGVASGMNANIRTIGGCIGAAVVGSIITAGSGVTGLAPHTGYRHAFLVLAIVAAGAAVAAVIVPTAPRDPRTHRELPAPLPHAELALVAGGTLFGDESE